MSRVALVELMAFLLPVPLEWSKKTDIKGLALMRGVRWKTKYHNPIFFGKLNRLQLKMRTVAIK